MWDKGKAGLITEVIFISNPSSKNVPNHYSQIFKLQVENSYLAQFFGDETKMKLPSKLSHLQKDYIKVTKTTKTWFHGIKNVQVIETFYGVIRYIIKP